MIPIKVVQNQSLHGEVNSTSRKSKKPTKSRIDDQVKGKNLEEKFLETVDLPNGNFSLKIRARVGESIIGDLQSNNVEKFTTTSDTRKLSGDEITKRKQKDQVETVRTGVH